MSIDLIINNNANLRPRDEIKVEKVTPAPYPDNRRIKVTVEVTPFRERPNLEITILDADGKRVSNTSAIALMNFRSVYVLHLRGLTDTTGSYTVRTQLYYESLDEVQHTLDAQMQLPVQNPEQNTETDTDQG